MSTIFTRSQAKAMELGQDFQRWKAEGECVNIQKSHSADLIPAAFYSSFSRPSLTSFSS
jgi:hypothetical protein